MKHIEINEQFERALQIMNETPKHLFVTGKAGTGKSTLLEYFREHTGKKIVVLAPTGVAALNVRGQTVHSFFRFRAGITLEAVKTIVKSGRPNIYRKLDAIVIDEVSMVRADLMDCIDKFMRLNTGDQRPFGGKQMIFIGDLYQLPPVMTGKERKIFSDRYQTGYFFSADVMQTIDMEMVELEKIYRQKDDHFIHILNAIRNNTVTDSMLDQLNRRFIPDYDPPADALYIYLTSRNDQARRINEDRLTRIRKRAATFEALVVGAFSESHFPTDPVLTVKQGAQVMMVNNDADGRWVNGSVGKIVRIGEVEEIIEVELPDGLAVPVTPHSWELFSYRYNPETRRIESERLGIFEQYPLRLAWAVTIHKGQGKTFRRVIVDIGRGTFAPGQMYVALSRCTTLDGIVLKQKIQKKHIFTDWQIVKFITGHQYRKSEQNLPLEEKVELIRQAIQNKQRLEMTYLKAKDEKSKRVVEPRFVGQLEYAATPYLGMEAFCLKRRDLRNFRVERILELSLLDP
jgi:ATP-dependent exoDNAse (exonuclease V) alpha subunit